VIARFPIPLGKAFFRWTWTCILLPENWFSWISPNFWRDTIFKWTHRLLKEVDSDKEACFLHFGAVIREDQGEGAIWSRKCHSWKDCPGNLTSYHTDNVNFCTSRPYQHEASRHPVWAGIFFERKGLLLNSRLSGNIWSYVRTYAGNFLQWVVFGEVTRGPPFSVFSKIILLEHIELPAKLLDYFLRSNKSNINQ